MRDPSLPLSRLVLFLLGSCGIISIITAVNFVKARASFPAWFAPIFLGGMVCFLGMIFFQIWSAVCAHEAEGRRYGMEAKWLWGLLIGSVICTSSLHGFAPFRPDILQDWSQLPSFLRFIHFNYIFTAALLAGLIGLAAAYFFGYRHLASAGLPVLAGLMLVPNDDCPNAFNQPWIDCFGASPMMFLCNSVVLLIGFCGLEGIRPRAAALMMGLINAGTLFLGLGHLTGVIW